MKESLFRFWLSSKMAIRSLSSHPMRSLLTLVGIVIGIVALVAMMSLIRGLRNSVADATRPLGIGVFQVQKEPRFTRRSRMKRISEQRKSFNVADVRTLQQRLRLVSSIGGEMWDWGVRVETSERRTGPVAGISGAMPPFLDANGIELEAGRFINDNDIEMNRPVAVIGADIVKTLFPLGAYEALTSTIRVKGRELEVIGVMQERPSLFGAAWRNSIVAIPISTFQRFYGFRSLHITFTAIDRDDVQPAMDEATVAIRFMRGVGLAESNDFEIFSNDSIMGQLDQLALALTVAAASICFLALLVGGIGVMNIQLVSVVERTREIGIRKALGAKPRTILFQFVVEAVVLAVFGGAGGVMLAQLASYGLGRILELPTGVPYWAVGLALLSSAFIGLLFGIYPALRAARLDPIEALRYE